MVMRAAFESRRQQTERHTIRKGQNLNDSHTRRRRAARRGRAARLSSNAVNDPPDFPRVLFLDGIPTALYRGEPGHTRDTRGHTGTRITQKNLTTIPKSRAPAPQHRRALTQGDAQDTHGSHTRITFIERLCCALQYHCLTPMITPVWYHSAQAPSMVQLALWVPQRASSESSHRDGSRRRAMVPVLCQAVAGWLASRRASSHPAVAHIRRPQQWRQTRGTWPWLHRRRGARRSGSASRFLRSATNPSGASITASRLRKVAIGCIQVAEGSLKVWGEPAVKAPLELREHFGSLIVWEPAVRAWIASRAARAMSGASPA
jgi:hypothetical protein